MLTRCAWCGDRLDGGTDPDRDQPISHGICASCERELTAQISVPLQEFLASLNAPVMLVDVETGGRVVTANPRALDATGKAQHQVRDQLLGEVFECANATLPGGCGHTVHCSGCAIRRTVETTWETGKAMTRVPATLQPMDGDGPVEIEISAERVDDRVLLRLDRPLRPDRDAPTG